MPRYAAFLRGVSPMNIKMPELKKAFESAGFTNVATVLSSGNVVFDAARASEATLQRRAEAALYKIDKEFLTILRPLGVLKALVATDPYTGFRLAPNAKRIVTFVRTRPKANLELPIELDGARILLIRGGEIFSAYVPTPKGAVFMNLIEKTFGREVTTRTWDTVAKVARR